MLIIIGLWDLPKTISQDYLDPWGDGLGLRAVWGFRLWCCDLGLERLTIV